MDAGLLGKNDVEFFFNKYKYNSELIVTLERRLLNESYDYEKWHRMLVANSSLTRRLFAENEKNLEAFILPVINNAEQVRSETAACFLLHVLFFLFENHSDLYITEDLVQALRKNTSLLSAKGRFDLDLDLGVSGTLTCRDSTESIDALFVDAEQQFPHAAADADRTTKIHLVFACLFRMLNQCVSEHPDVAVLRSVAESGCIFIEHYLDDDVYGQMWCKGADIPHHVQILQRFIRLYPIFGWGVTSFSGNAEDSTVIEKWLSEEYETEKTEGKINSFILLFYYKLQYVRGGLSKEAYRASLTSYYESLHDDGKITYQYPENSFPSDDDPLSPQFADLMDTMKLFSGSFGAVFFLMPELLSLSDDTELRGKLFQDITEFYIQMPYADRGVILDRFIADNLKIVFRECCKTTEDCLSFLRTVFLHRQISTAIHSSMVSRIAVLCFDAFSQKNPELFRGINGLETKESIRDFIQQAGLCHDIGKLFCTDLVNLHFRKVTKHEMMLLREHAKRGGELARSIPQFERFADVIEGHHKWWNGTGGYPESFDNTKSPIKIIIDLISICDTIDAATDYLGRNYTYGKTFVNILEELKEKRGTVYSPVLVDMLDADHELCTKIDIMTGEGRTEVYYETYKKSVQPNVTFSRQDERTVHVITAADMPYIQEFYRECYPSADFQTKIEPHISELSGGISARGYVLCDKRNRVFGILFGRRMTNVSGEDFYAIDELLVAPKFRRKGFATMLVSFASRDLADARLKKMSITIVKDFHYESFFWINGFTDSNTCRMDKEISRDGLQ